MAIVTITEYCCMYTMHGRRMIFVQIFCFGSNYSWKTSFDSAIIFDNPKFWNFKSDTLQTLDRKQNRTNKSKIISMWKFYDEKWTISLDTTHNIRMNVLASRKNSIEECAFCIRTCFVWTKKSAHFNDWIYM